MSFFLDSTMGIDPQSDDSQSGAQESDEEVPFNVAEFNSAVIDAIEQYKSSSTDDPPPFGSKEQLCSKLFRPVTGEVEMQYQVMLGQGSILEDFARCDTTDNVEAMQAMKPAMDGKQQVQRYGEAQPKEESTSQEVLQAVKPVADGKQKKSVRFSDLVT
ncbi:hypothetical protein RSOL_160830, partial [Rhizoctonia solani AG-3 Rhs1AP]